jgi:preprotein translocase subunit YajC
LVDERALRDYPPAVVTNDLLLAQNVLPKAGAAGAGGTVQDSAPASAGAAGGAPAQSPLAGFMPIIMMLVIFVPFFLLMSRRQKKETQARSALKKGDRVVTNAGLIGELVEMDDKIAKVKISPSVTVQMVANTVSPFTEPDKASSKELKEAKAVSDKK